MGLRKQGRKSFKAFDLCAGIGGFRAAAEQLRNVAVKFAGFCEIDPHAVKTYTSMFGPSMEGHVGDLRWVTRLRGEEHIPRLPRRAARARQIRDRLPSFDLLTCGFPCQPHSLMGNRLGFNDGRGSLFFDIAEVLRAVEPKGFILENVRAIKSVNGGVFFSEMLAVLEKELGYNIRVWELNAADYGAPQTRRRIFIVGSQGKLPETPPRKRTAATNKYRTVWHLLARDVASKYYLSEKILETILKDQHKGYRRKADINRLIARPLTRTMHKMHRASQDNYYSDDFINGEFDPSASSVIFAAKGSDRIRRITPREAFQIQTFAEPLIDRAMACGISDTQLYMQAGNAVPPLMAKAVLEHAFGTSNA